MPDYMMFGMAGGTSSLSQGEPFPISSAPSFLREDSENRLGGPCEGHRLWEIPISDTFLKGFCCYGNSPAGCQGARSET